MIALGTLVGARLAGLPHVTTALVVEVTISITLLFVASVIVNDCHDVKEDAVNRPESPVASGLISPAAGRVVAAIVFGAAIALALRVGPEFGLVAAVLTVLSLLYSARLKSVPFAGNVLVAATMTSPLWCWMILSPRVPWVLIEVSVSCFVFRIGAEIVKTAEDYVGDAWSGVRTVATTWGPAIANRIGAALMLSGLILCSLPVFGGRGTVLYAVVLASCVTLLAVGSIRGALRPVGDVELGRSLVVTQRCIMSLMAVAWFMVPAD